MNHLTNLYKHKCEQLQEQLYNLTKMLNEAIPPIRVPRVRIPKVPVGTIMSSLASRLARFANMTPAEIIRAIDTGGIEFANYVAQNYGRIVQVGSSYQRLLPDGTLQMYGSNNTWVNINKPGFMSAFGPISSNGIVIPMDVYRGIGHGGISPGDIVYTPGRPIGPDYGVVYRDPGLHVPYYPGP